MFCVWSLTNFLCHLQICYTACDEGKRFNYFSEARLKNKFDSSQEYVISYICNICVTDSKEAAQAHLNGFLKCVLHVCFSHNIHTFLQAAVSEKKPEQRRS